MSRNNAPSSSPLISPRRIMRNVLADKPSPVSTPDVFVRNEARLQQQLKEEEANARKAEPPSLSAIPETSLQRRSLSRNSGSFGRDSGIFGDSARTPRSLLRHALPGLPSSFPTPPTPPTPALSSPSMPSLAAPSPVADFANASTASFHSPLQRAPRFTRPFTSPSTSAFDHLLPFTPPAEAIPIKRGRGRPSIAAAASAAAAAAAPAAPSSASKSSSQNISIVGGQAAAVSTSTPATTSKASRRNVTGALPRHVTKELFLAQCLNVSVSSSAIGMFICPSRKSLLF
jgi:hypothetical protein